MMQKILGSFVVAIAVLAAACSSSSDSTVAPSSALAVSMASTFSTTPAGFEEMSSSFDASAASATSDLPFEPAFDDHGGHGPRGFGPLGIGPGFGLGFMGGGLLGVFLGDGLGHFHNDDNCMFSTTTGHTCTDTTRGGIIVTRVEKYTTTGGTVETRIDSLTNTVASSFSAKGSVTRRDSSTSSVDESSAQTVTGLTKGSTSRTINSASKGTENTTGNSREGNFTATRTVGDTINGIVIPLPSTSHLFPFPTAGTIIRAMNATVTISGQSPAVSSRREVITYDGSATAKVVITHDSTTQNCTLPLPHGRLTCS
ncbi:MAG TPA: hypothetical protein VGM50_00210 [Gemmatimonadaceae bacterium]